ncbi:Zinc finger CCHC domain-containing protein 12 [Bienertia sinuspersici]
MKRGVGRPVKNRKRGEEEQRKGKRSKTLKCGNCGEFGHNKLTCQRAPTRKERQAQNKRKEKTTHTNEPSTN